MKRVAISLLAATAFVSTWAQTAPSAVGQLQSVQGLVTVSSGDQLVNGANGVSVFEGSRIVTTSSGGATVVLSGGCSITLAPNQSLLVQAGQSCAALIASVQSVGGSVPPAVVAGGGAGGGAGMLVAGGVGLGIVALAVRNDNRNDQASSR